MTAKDTTIALAEQTRDALFRLKDSPNDTYDDVIWSLLEEQ